MLACFWQSESPACFVDVLKALQIHSSQNAEFLFSVTAGESQNMFSGGYCMLCAICQGKGFKYNEQGYARYESILRLAVLASKRIGMLDHQSGAAGDTHLMKAAANGNNRAVFYLLQAGARDPHLGYLNPPHFVSNFLTTLPIKAFVWCGWGAEVRGG